MSRPVKLNDFAPETNTFLDEVIAGLSRTTRELSSKFFYDERGSQLFEEITRLDEYYLTRTEIGILKDNMDDIADCVGEGAMLIEYGSGSSEKTTVLLDHLPNLAAYVPIDISKEHLLASARRIAARYPGIEVLPVAADYNDPQFEIPTASRPVSHRVIYYPGSTIGNFHPPEAIAFLKRMHRVCGEGGGLLLGVDLEKDPAILHAAYNDKLGVTAEFNLNVLRRINRELRGDFDVDGWRHRAIYNEEKHRIEMHLVSKRRQRVTIGGESFDFEPG